jgi:SAM-dependent MidA family methyltransferase
MGLSSTGSTAPSPEFLAVFRAHADTTGTMSFAQFMQLALYDPQVGYYRAERRRIGLGAETDFFTASTSNPVFGELVVAASIQLLRAAGRDPSRHAFIEIGAETPGGILESIEHPFAQRITKRIGDPLNFSGDCIVFSNELFDAQPCRRTVFRHGGWRELGVQLQDGALMEVELGPAPDLESPDSASEGYHFDRPVAATELAQQIVGQDWRGLFVAFDYGKTLRELLEHSPQGTARAYFRHTQSNDLLAHPGEQDLTCHVCWDWLEGVLRTQGFTDVMVESQETFFVRRASDWIAAASAADAAHFSRRKLSLLQLLHPAHLGQKFQVLHGIR